MISLLLNFKYNVDKNFSYSLLTSTTSDIYGRMVLMQLIMRKVSMNFQVQIWICILDYLWVKQCSRYVSVYYNILVVIHWYTCNIYCMVSDQSFPLQKNNIVVSLSDHFFYTFWWCKVHVDIYYLDWMFSLSPPPWCLLILCCTLFKFLRQFLSHLGWMFSLSPPLWCLLVLCCVLFEFLLWICRQFLPHPLYANNSGSGWADVGPPHHSTKCRLQMTLLSYIDRNTVYIKPCLFNL